MKYVRISGVNVWVKIDTYKKNINKQYDKKYFNSIEEVREDKLNELLG